MSEGQRRSIILTRKVFFLDDRRFESDLMLELELYGAMIGSVDAKKDVSVMQWDLVYRS